MYGKNKKILIIEDDTDINNLICEALVIPVRRHFQVQKACYTWKKTVLTLCF